MGGFSKGDEVSWTWGSGTARGRIAEVHHARVEKTIKGNKVVRNATRQEPAYLIEQEDGDLVLKSASEIGKA